MEIRICDIPLTVDETIAITTLIQALVAKIYKLRIANLNFMSYKRMVLNENKWRASRYGLDGKLIDFGKEIEVDTRELIHELIEFVDDVVDDLGSREELEKVPAILKAGTGADRQLAVYEKTSSLESVVDFIIEETMKGV